MHNIENFRGDLKNENFGRFLRKIIVFVKFQKNLCLWKWFAYQGFICYYITKLINNPVTFTQLSQISF